MAYIRAYYHRDPKRLAAHVRYIAGREDSRGLRGLGQPFRELRGDIGAAVRLLQEHARAVRTQAGGALREGPFLRLLFTLPDDLAARVMAADGRLAKGSELVLRDAVEAVFRSAARHLQGVYAVHFHSTARRAHPHVHVDLSPLDTHGRTAFLTRRQQDLLRDAWGREVERALVRVERHLHPPERAPAQPEALQRGSHGHVLEPGQRAGEPGGNAPAEAPSRRARRDGQSTPWAAPVAGSRRAPDETPRRRVGRSRDALPLLTQALLGPSGLPLLDLFTRALLGRAQARLRLPAPNLALRDALGLQVPVPGRLRGVARFFGVRPSSPLRWP
jgi:hypothetical protein